MAMKNGDLYKNLPSIDDFSTSDLKNFLNNNRNVMEDFLKNMSNKNDLVPSKFLESSKSINNDTFNSIINSAGTDNKKLIDTVTSDDFSNYTPILQDKVLDSINKNVNDNDFKQSVVESCKSKESIQALVDMKNCLKLNPPNKDQIITFISEKSFKEICSIVINIKILNKNDTHELCIKSNSQTCNYDITNDSIEVLKWLNDDKTKFNEINVDVLKRIIKGFDEDLMKTLHNNMCTLSSFSD